MHPSAAGLRRYAAGPLLFCFVLLPCVLPASASPLTEALRVAARLDLAHHPTWLKLLHFEGRLPQSVVLADDFFLSPEGRSDPQAELRATLEAYFLPWKQDTDGHPRCRFPARYYWLSRQLPLPGYTLKEPHCRRLSTWALLDRVKSVSLLLVSGYLGNPASTFGHALLKLNTDSSDDDYGLFDLTLNYGALIPQNENALRYVARGLFGGYEAGFSDRYFYTQDLVYSHTEFRDMWDYRLALSDHQRTLLILHIWEIIGRKFVYYFLTKNCAFRLAGLVDLVVDDLVIERARLWYLPVQMFHRLNAIDAAKTSSGNGTLVETVRFIPSSKRVLAHRMQRLTAQEIRAMNAIIRSGPPSLTTHLKGFSDERKTVILDSLLAYHKYRFMSRGSADDPTPRTQERGIAGPVATAGAAETRPRCAGSALASRRVAPHGSRGRYGQQHRKRVPLSAPDVVALQIGTCWPQQHGRRRTGALGRCSGACRRRREIFLDQLDLIRLSSLNTLPVPLAGENPLSWQLHVGVVRVDNGDKPAYDGAASVGVGYAKSWHPRIIGYAMADLAVHTLAPHARLRPHLGLSAHLAGLRTWAYVGTESIGYRGRFQAVWGGKLEVSLTKRLALQAEFSNERATRASLGLNVNW